MQELRGNEMSMIFQDPVMSLDQIYTVGDQIIEAILTHEKMPKADAKKRALSLLGDVGIPIRNACTAPIPLSCRAVCARGS